MAGSIIKNIKTTKCGWDGKLLGKGTSTTRGHSHKELMKCLYRSNVEIFRSQQTLQAKEQEIKKLQTELAGFIIKQQREKEVTGIMDVKEKPTFNPLGPGVKVKDDKELAKDLLKAEENGRSTK